MGRDKALLPFCGRPLIEIAVGKLRSFCSGVSVAGNRDDLAVYAPVVHETRIGTGPAAGLEAGLQASAQPWALFLPVDVPLVPEFLLWSWAAAVVGGTNEGLRLSFLRAGGNRQPTFCLLHKDCLEPLTAITEAGERKLDILFDKTASRLGPAALWVAEAETFAANDGPHVDVDLYFSNVNWPEDLSALELRVSQALPISDAKGAVRA